MKAIKKELGELDEHSTEIKELREKIKKAKMPPDALTAAEKELDRLAKIPPASAEYTVARTYLDWLVELPWSETTEDNLDIDNAQKTLDEDHYDLEKVKKRILEYLAVRKLKANMKGPILCFVGPPGVGKTSLGKSIARTMGRKFMRISLGGVRDEAEIRGHRRTYVGALPGRIIQGIKKSGSNNPIFMLDEVDKIGMDFRGDPSSALLEVLDPEQNFSFSDHYIDVPFDLSKVMFITTANVLDTIPPALRDRMETLELPGYSEDQKIMIAKQFLIPKQVAEHGLSSEYIEFKEDALQTIITSYTREAGVRNLEREIAAICRGVAKDVARGIKEKVAIGPESLHKLLGPIKFFSEVAERTSLPGVATGLAWTPTGGDIIFVEATKMRGEKGLTLTGQLGDVMKESAQAALAYVRTKSKELGIDEDFFAKNDIHIHVPAGAIPKDGPSAGVTMFVALTSLLTNTPVRSDVAMTGEITLRGLVLPVGGIKEKVLAGMRAGIKTIILPKKNEKDLEEIPEHIRNQMNFEFIQKMDEAIEHALKHPDPRTTEQGTMSAAMG
jgi:ATP-dependent Lon protease